MMCELEINFNNSSHFKISNNQFCPPYPECIEESVGYQDTSECFELGDVNFDGIINVMDIIILIDFILDWSEPTEQQYFLSDIYPDGELNIMDVVMLVDMVLNS